MATYVEAASMAAPAAAGGDLDHFDLNNSMTVEEHNELVKSVELLRGSVGRIILADKRTKAVIQTGTASIVYRGDERSLFLTCGHNFGEKLCGEMIRLPNGDTVKDYPIEHIVYRHEDRDLLLFSVKDQPQLQCLEFSTDEVKKHDKVVLVGFSGAPLQVNNKELEPAPVVAQSILTGVVCTDPYKSEGDQHHEKMQYNCRAVQGHSGSPLFKSGKLVAIHILSDKNWREGVSTNTILHSLREHLQLGTDNEDTMDKLLESLYNKSGHVLAELQRVNEKKNTRKQARRG